MSLDHSEIPHGHRKPNLYSFFNLLTFVDTRACVILLFTQIVHMEKKGPTHLGLTLEQPQSQINLGALMDYGTMFFSYLTLTAPQSLG